jgi:hypothetical protein
VPYGPYQNKGYFKVIERKRIDFHGNVRITIILRVYPVKGIEFITKLIDREEQRKANKADTPSNFRLVKRSVI